MEDRDMVIKHFMRRDYPGALMTETSDTKIKTRPTINNLEEIKRLAGPKCFAVQFYDIMVETIDEIELKSKPMNFTKRYVFGKLYTPEEVKRDHGERSILYRNVVGNGYDGAIKTRLGNWQTYRKDDDVVIEC